MRDRFFNKKTLFTLFSFMAFLFGGIACFFSPSIQEVRAEDARVLTVAESSNVISHTIEGTDATVFFYVAKIDSQDTTTDRTLSNGDFVFLKEKRDMDSSSERILISFGRKSENYGYTATDAQGNPILSTANISLCSVTIKCNGTELSLTEIPVLANGYPDYSYANSNHVFLKETTNEAGTNSFYEYSAIIDVNSLDKEGKFEISFGDCTFQTIGKSETVSNLPTFTFYAFKNKTYNDGNFPKVSIQNANTVSSTNVEYYREYFYNYQNFEINGRQILPTISFDAHNYRIAISRTFQGVATNYLFSIINGKVQQTVVPSTKPPLRFDEENCEITLKDLGVYAISYTYIYNDGTSEIEMTNVNKNVKKDSMSIFGYQAMYSSYDETNPTELRTTPKVISYNGEWICDSKQVLIDFDTMTTVVGETDYNVFYKKGSKVQCGENYCLYDGTGWKYFDNFTMADAVLDFVNNKAIVGANEYSFVFSSETEFYCDTYSASTFAEDKESVVSSKVASTNQGPVYFQFNSSIVTDESFYWFKPANSSEWETNEKSFINSYEKAGEYFVKAVYKYGGYKEQIAGGLPDKTHTQYFYFKITSETPGINVMAMDGVTANKLYDGEYTKHDVIIQKPVASEFDYPIEIVVKSANYNSNSFTKLHNQNQTLTEGAKYQIQVRYGKKLAKSQYTYFIIDKSPINETYFYAAKTSQQTGSYVVDKQKNDISNKSYINSDFVLQWANKNSGAKITTYYNFYPLVKGSTTSTPVTNSQYSATETWVASDYYLNFDFDPEDVNSTVNIGYTNTYNTTLSAASVLTEQGLYLFKLVDEAGWEKEVYMLLDKTSARVLQRKTDSTYQLPTTLNHVSEDMYLVFGTHKEISFPNISGTSTLFSEDKLVNTGNAMFDNYLLSEVQKGNIKPSNSHIQTHSYVIPIKKVVQRSANKKQDTIVAQGTNGIAFSNRELFLGLFDSEGKLNEDYYEYFIVDAANFDLANSSVISVDDISYLSGYHSIRMTTDLSGSVVLTDNEQITSDKEVKPLSVMKKQDQDNAGLTTLRFSKADKIYFAYRNSSDFEVETITCLFYALEFDATHRSYKYSSTPITITINFVDASIVLESGYLIGSVNAVVGVNGLTKPGKYVITRQYSIESASYVSGKNDYMTRVFECFVDRNAIVSIPSYQTVGEEQVEMKVVGEYLNLNALDGKVGQVSFNDFYMQNQKNINLNYLFSMESTVFTNKSPVKIYVPVSKYGWFIDNVFSFAGVNANVVAGYSASEPYYVFHKDLMLSLKVYSYSGEIFETSLVDAQGYLTLAFTNPGKYIAVFKDGVGFEWYFSFTIRSATPELALNAVYVEVDEEEVETILSTAEIGENSSYTNADKIMVTYVDPADEFMAKIDINNIYYSVNQTLDPANITQPGRVNPYTKIDPSFYQSVTRYQSFTLPQRFVDGDVIRIYVQFEGDSANYPADKFFLIKTISIDQTAPKTNLAKLATSQVISKTRVEGKRFNKTNVSSTDYPNFAYPMNGDFVFTRTTSENSTETYEIYYRLVANKYSSSVPEVIVPTDPSALTNPPPANLFVSSSYTPLTSLSNFFSYSVSVSGLYEIVEKDVAGNYTVYTVYYYAPMNDDIVVNYTTEGDLKTADVTTLPDSELTAYNSFTLNSLRINNDPWWNLTVRDEKNNAWTFRKTPFITASQLLMSDGTTISITDLGKVCGGIIGEDHETGNKIYGFQNNSRYSFTISNRIRNTSLEFHVVVGDSSRKLEVQFTESGDNLLLNITKDAKNIVKLKSISAELVKKQEDGTFIFTESGIVLKSELSASPLLYQVDGIRGYDIIKIDILTNFGAENSYYYLPDSPSTQSELVGTDIFTDAYGDKISSEDVEFYYNNVIYDVVVGVRNAVPGVTYFTKTTTEKVSKIVLKAAPLTYGSGSYVGAERVFDLQIYSNINDADDDAEVQTMTVRIDNLLPQVNLFDDYSNLKNPILNANSITKNAVNLRFVEDDKYVVVLRNLTTQTDTVVESGTRVADVGEYQIIVKFAEIYLASYTKYFSITSSALSLYAVVGTNSAEDIPTFITPSASYYKYNGNNIKYYISNFINVDVVVDDDLAITKTLISESVSDQTTTQIWHIYNTGALNQSIYIDEYIAVTYVPASKTILSKLQRSAISVSSGINWDDIKSDISHKIVLTETSTSVDSVTIKWDEYHLIENNKILVDYYFNSNLVFQNMQISSIDLKTSGKHSFVFHDMAGNYHYFTKGIEETSIYDVFFVKSVVFEVNGETPINYAVYDSSVELSIPENTLSFYNHSSPPVVKVLRNGEEYEVETILRKTTITESGFYQVWYEAGPEGDKVLIEPIYFTVIDPLETRWAFEYEKYENYQITSVKKNSTEMLVEPVRSLFVSIDDEATGVGKYEVMVKVVRNDTLLPVQWFNFSFWINDGEPPIIISAEQGVETIPTITVSFNAKNMYKELGNCYVKITGMDKVDINEETLKTLEEVQLIEITAQGNYYVQVYTSNGNLVYSYRVVKRDPLNGVSIALIVVGSVVFVAGLAIFFKLRKRTKIR